MIISLDNVKGSLAVVAKDSYKDKDELSSAGFRWNPDLKGWVTSSKTAINELIEAKNNDISRFEIEMLKSVSSIFTRFTVKVDSDIIKISGDTWEIRDEMYNSGFKWFSDHYRSDLKDFVMNKDYLETQINKELFELILSQLSEVDKTITEIVIKQSDTINLYDHQKDGVQFIHDRQMSLLNYDMGTGKSHIVNALAHSLDKKMFVVVPALVRLNFFKECVTYGLTSSIYPKLPTMKAKYKKIYGEYSWKEAQTSITSYATMNLHYKKNTNALNEIVNEFDILVLDESQYIKQFKSGRSKVMLALIELFKLAGKKVIFMSGTPIMNRPAELYTTLKAINPNMEGYFRFVEKYNSAIQGRYGLELGSASNTDELFKRMRTFTSRVTKEQCLDLPERTRTAIDLNCKIVRPDDKKYENALGFLGAYKRNTAEGKAKDTIEFVSKIAENEQVVLFSWFTDVNDLLAMGLRKKGFRVAQIHSKMGLSSAEKEDIVSDFTNGKYDIIIGGIKILGVGINLVSASTVVFNDFSWVPADMEQASDRIYRIGQSNKCSIYYMVANDEFDEMLWSLLNQKFETIYSIMDNTPNLEMSDNNTTIMKELMKMWKGKKKKKE